MYIHVQSCRWIIWLFEKHRIRYCIYGDKVVSITVPGRSDSGKSGHLLISVPADSGTEVEAAPHFSKRQQRASELPNKHRMKLCCFGMPKIDTSPPTVKFWCRFPYLPTALLTIMCKSENICQGCKSF